MPRTKKATVIIVHPDLAVGRAFTLLCTENNLNVLECYADGTAAINGATLLRPQIVILHSDLTGPSAPDVIKQIREADVPCGIILLCRNRDEALAHQTTGSGADFYVSLADRARDIVQAIEAAVHGRGSRTPIEQQQTITLATTTLIPKQLLDGRYLIEELLGKGGMGTVYRATDTKLGRTVAIKFLDRGPSVDDKQIRRFHQEARTIATFNHPNIVSLYDLVTHEGRDYLVLEYVAGANLRAHIETSGSPPARAIEIIAQIAAGLVAAHAAGFVHRDIKPENIMVTPKGEVKILDFGLAKLKLRVPPSAKSPVVPTTEPGMLVGTVAYMSPEQARGEEVDHRTDIFSLGVVFYELLTGQQPFRRGSVLETLKAIIYEVPTAVEGSPPMPGLSAVLTRSLEKPVDQRYQEATALEAALHALLSNH